jgi:PleD family two-component response regulator
MLSDKLVRDNVRMRDFLSAKTRFQEDSTQKEQRFDIALDLLAEKGMSAEEAKAEIDARASQLPKRILVVEDDPVSRALLVKALSAYSVIEAENGLDAIKQIGKGTPDLVITDVQMPEMDGIGLLKQLRKRSRNSRYWQ